MFKHWRTEGFFDQLMAQSTNKSNPYIHIIRRGYPKDDRQEVLDELIGVCRLLGIEVDVDNIPYVGGIKPYKIRLRRKS